MNASSGGHDISMLMIIVFLFHLCMSVFNSAAHTILEISVCYGYAMFFSSVIYSHG